MKWNKYNCLLVSELFNGLGLQYPCCVCGYGYMLHVYTLGKEEVYSCIICNRGGCKKLFVEDDKGNLVQI